ncbi:MAG: SUMF1/EgtB/PvdO family nonheme iron enzyme [Victivallales bacterium]|jgi:formylglycine-generating enzyme required for sulfatase activity/TolB-like protein
MKTLSTIILSYLLICFSAALTADDNNQYMPQNKKISEQIKAENSSGAVNPKAKRPSDAGKPWVAVHDFSIAPSLAEWGLNGWDIAEKFENELTQQTDYRIITRAKIAKVLKEQKVGSSGVLEASKFGALVGADYIVTGQIDQKGNRLTIIAKMIDVKIETGKILKSYDLSMRIVAGKECLENMHKLIETLADKISMSPGDFLDFGILKLKEGHYEEASEAFREVQNTTPLDEIRKLLDKHANEKPLPLSNDLKTLGAYLDYGLGEMDKGNSREAFSAFIKIKESGATGEIRNFLELHDALKKVEAKLKEQQERLKTVIAEADRLFLQAKAAQDKAESEMTPAELCDRALLLLDSMVSDPKYYLAEDSRGEIEDMINKIKAFKTNVAGGPVPNKKWMVPDLKLNFTPIAPGFFLMGSATAADDADNKPHPVTITRPFWMGLCEITIGQFLYYLQNPNGDPNEPKKADKDKEIMWTNDYCPITKDYKMKSGGGDFWGDENQPIVGINWKAADQFCKWLTKREALAKRLPSGYEYRLPTEAEWEYACRASASKDKSLPPSTLYCFGDAPGLLPDYAFFKLNSGGKTFPAGKKKPNAWGLYDMHGNVWEWCHDWYDGPYLGIEVKDPKGSDASADNLKVLRGGSFMSNANELASSTRYQIDYKSAKRNIGFRIVCGPKL